jgi:hypothetical protein
MVVGVKLEAIQFLVRRKYPNAPEIMPAPRPPMSGDHVGGLAAFKAEQERRKSEAQKYAVELSQLPAKEFQALYNLETKNFHEEVRAKKENQENSQFFNRPSAKADFDHWSRAAHWTLEEAVALSFGRNPEIVNWASIGRWRAESSFVLLYDRLLDLARRAVPWQQLFDPVAPGIFIGWVRRNEIAFPQELEDAVRSRGNHIINWKQNYDELQISYEKVCAQLLKTQSDDLELIQNVAAVRDQAITQVEELRKSIATGMSKETSATREISTRERDSLLKMVIGMAVKGYGYSPFVKRSDRVTEIASDLENAGVPLDADTVRKWLKAGAELLPAPTDE